jgi:hypothetical protein
MTYLLVTNKSESVVAIKFHDPEAWDPDWRVKHCYILMIAEASKDKNGVEIYGNMDHQVVIMTIQTFTCHYFKSFDAAAPYCWCQKKYWWYIDCTTLEVQVS